MMISPNVYLNEHKKDSFEQLIAERDSLIQEINELEQLVFSDDHTGSEWRIMPNPATRYQMSLEYLSALCLFIKEKYNTEIVHGETMEDV